MQVFGAQLHRLLEPANGGWHVSPNEFQVGKQPLKEWPARPFILRLDEQIPRRVELRNVFRTELRGLRRTAIAGLSGLRPPHRHLQ